ncbi:hypothetical protein D3C71_1857550 [compost metagenome]
MVNIDRPITNGNQPPSNSLSRLEAKKVKSMQKKNSVGASATHRGYFQPKRSTKKVSTVVIVMSRVTAMP